MTDPSTIIIWQTAFLGDAVLTLPLVQTVARRHPGADIHFVVRAGFQGLFAAHPDIAAVHGFDKRGRQKGVSGLLGMAAELRSLSPDIFISAHTSLRTALTARASGAGQRIGYSSPVWNRLAYTTTVDRRFHELEEIERLLELARPLGVSQVLAWPDITLPPEAVKAAEDFWRQHGPGPYLGIHPGSTWPTKRWPAEGYARLARMALNAGLRVLVFGGPDETGLCREVTDQVALGGHPGLHDLSGRLSLTELAAFLGRLSVYVTNDSGPMHLAWAQSTPVVALFGPTVRSLGFFPRGETSVVLESALDCRPCGLHGHALCPEGHHRCMMDLTPESAWAEAQKLLESGA
jgi:heptosyltransferase-2